MFSSRHPFLFFLLSGGVLLTICIVMLSMVVIAIGSGDLDSGGESVGIIDITGAIVDSHQTVRDLKWFRENDAVKAIVVRINSPGGGVGPSQEIYREIRRTLDVKTVIASMGAVAASGGYYIAAAADGIVANPGTITGSIGVIMGYTNFEEVMRKIGLTAVVIKSGEYKDMGSPTRPMTDKEKALLEGVTLAIHNQFVSDVATGREITKENVAAIADGRILTGEQAMDLGLVDRMGNFNDAVQWAAEMGGIEGDVQTLYPEKEKLPFMRYLMDSMLQLWTESRSGGGIAPQARLSTP